MANALNDAGMIDEVYKVVAELKLGWSQIEGVVAE
jgi:flagellin-specific chaperone FliS